MKRDWILKPFAVVLLVALFAWAGSQSARAQTFSADIQQFWSQLRTGAIAFATGRVQTSGYLNFGNTVGTNGYGFRDGAGTLQFKNSGGSWAAFLSSTGNPCPGDGTTVIKQVATNDLGIYTGATACVGGTLRFDVSATAVTSALTLTVPTGAYNSLSVKFAGTSKGFFSDGDPAVVGCVDFYLTDGTNNGWICNNRQVTGVGMLIVGNAGAAVNDNGIVTLRPQAANATSFDTLPAMLFGAYDGGFTIGPAEHWAAFCYSTGSSWCDFTAGLNGGGAAQKVMWELMGNSTINHNVVRNAASSIDNVSTIGYNLNNAFASTVGLPSQWSPGFTWCGSAWKSNATAASQADCFKAENRTLTGSTVTTQTWALGSSVNGGAYTDVLTVTSAGVLSGPTYASSGSGMAVANVGANSCGTTTATIAGNNNAFVITVGATAGTQCRVAFTFAAGTEWDCASNDDTTTVAVRTTPVDTTHTDLIGTFTAGDKVTGICFPR